MDHGLGVPSYHLQYALGKSVFSDVRLPYSADPYLFFLVLQTNTFDKYMIHQPRYEASIIFIIIVDQNKGTLCRPRFMTTFVASVMCPGNLQMVNYLGRQTPHIHASTFIIFHQHPHPPTSGKTRVRSRRGGPCERWVGRETSVCDQVLTCIVRSAP